MAFTEHDPVPTSVLDGAVEAYSRDRVYVMTAIFLAVITWIELSTWIWPDFILWKGDVVIPVLLILMSVKFFTVAWVFMHLKFDKPILTRVFYMGLVLAVLVYVAVLSMFRLWFPGKHT